MVPAVTSPPPAGSFAIRRGSVHGWLAAVRRWWHRPSGAPTRDRGTRAPARFGSSTRTPNPNEPAPGPPGTPKRHVHRGPARLRLRPWTAFWFLVAGLLAPASRGASPQPTEYQLKATLLFNLVKFTEWPTSAFADAKAPLVLGVIGEDPFGNALDLVIQDETVRGRRLVIRRYATGESPAACHLLFVARSEKDRLAELWSSLRGRPVLTVGDQPDFCAAGGMINLALSPTGTVRPEIDAAAARAAGLEISSRLLSLPMVRLVKPKP